MDDTMTVAIANVRTLADALEETDHTKPEDGVSLPDSLRLVAAAATQPPVVVLSKKERNAIQMARWFAATSKDGGGSKVHAILDTLDDLLDRDRAEYVAVKRGDVKKAWKLLSDFVNDEFIASHACKEVADRLAAAIDKAEGRQ